VQCVDLDCSATAVRHGDTVGVESDAFCVYRRGKEVRVDLLGYLPMPKLWCRMANRSQRVGPKPGLDLSKTARGFPEWDYLAASKTSSIREIT